MYGYIYLTTNLVNGKKYIGQHRSTTFDEKYHGSGVALVKAINKYGIDNFETHIIQECFSEEDLNKSEIQLIEQYNAVDSEDYYNIARGGEGHTCDPWNKGLTGITVSENSLAALDYGRHLPASDLQKQQLSERRRNCVVSEHTRELLRRQNLGRIGINNGVVNTSVFPEELHTYLDDGWVIGTLREYTDETYQKYKSTRDSWSEERKQEYKMSISSTLKSQGRRWLTDGDDSVYASHEEIQSYINKGYYFGRTLNKKK